jgi:hypothetical protein
VLSPDGKTVVSGGFQDGTVCFWDTTTGKVTRQLATPHRPTYTVAFTPDGKTVATAGVGQSVNLWDVATGEQVLQIGGLPMSWVGRVAFSPDGRTLAVAGNDNKVTLWETVSGGKRAEFVGHTAPCHTLAFSPDGRRLASGGDDTTILVWDVAGPGIAASSTRGLEALWSDLLGEESVKAQNASWALSAKFPMALALMEKHLKPVAAPAADLRKQFDRLLVDLDSDSFTTREKASQELDKLGTTTEHLIRAGLEKDLSAEVKRNLKVRLEKNQSEDKDSWVRTMRILEVVERAGTPEACRFLKHLGEGLSEARLTREAKGTLERLEQTAAPREPSPGRP